MSTQLRTALESHLAAVAPPPGDVARARREGLRIRRRRRTGAAVAGAVAASVVAFAGLELVSGTPTSTVVEDYQSLGRLDFSEGLRAYADPGGEIHLGGRTFDGSELEYLDTDATATPYGVVFYDRGRPMLLDETGEVTALVAGPVDVEGGFHPTAKADSSAPLVAWATLRDGTATITVHDLASRSDVGSTQVDCGDCDDLVIDALDGGVVFLRTEEGTSTWTVGEPDRVPFAGPGTRVASVRNGVVLYDGPEPHPPPVTGPDWYLVAGPVDGQLTFDGSHVVAWSSRLEPTRAAGEPLRLEAGPVRGLGFWSVDSDGSVLVAAPDGRYPRYLVHDCDATSGACVEVGPLEPDGGDPLFLGSDM